LFFEEDDEMTEEELIEYSAVEVGGELNRLSTVRA